MSSIEDIEYVIFRHPDPEAACAFMRDYGLLDLERRGERVYMRAYGDAPFSWVTSPGEPDLVGVGFRVSDQEALANLAARFGAMAVLSGFSRLVIDPNRALEDPTAIPVVSDDVVIPGNRALDAEAQAQRVEALFKPYHAAVAAAVSAIRTRGQVPVLVSVHSFTPAMRGVARPWHIGVLWDNDPRLPVPLIKALKADGRWCVGDNQPYSGRGTLGGTVETHATPAGYPNVLLEVRQDLIAMPEGAELWAQVIGDALEPLLSLPSLATIHHYPRA